MNPLRIRAASYRTFGELDLDLPAGCVAVIGINGAGKSATLEAIELALFGRCRTGDIAAQLPRDGSAESCEIELTFEHGGALYRVRRAHSSRGRGKTVVDFEVCRPLGAHDEAESWEPLTCESTRETDQLICKTLGYAIHGKASDTRKRAWRAFRASAFLAQADRDSFTEAAPADRKEVLCDVVGLGLWEQLRDRAKDDRAVAQAELQRLAGETVQARELADTKPAVTGEHDATVRREAALAVEVGAAEVAMFQLEEQYRAASEAAGKRATLEAKLQAARGELAQLQRADVAATEALGAIGVARDELESLSTPTQTDELVQRERDLLAAIAAHERAQILHATARQEALTASANKAALIQRHGELKTKASEIRDAIAAIEAREDARCDRCDQVLAGGSKAVAIESMTRDAAALTAQAEERLAAANAIELPDIPPPPTGEPPVAELADVRTRLERVQQQVQQRARLEERITGLQRTVDARPSGFEIAAAAKTCLALGAEIDECEPVDLATVQAAGAAKRAELAALREDHAAAASRRARLDERLDQIRKAEQKLADNAERERDLQAEVDLCLLLEKAYGRDGIPALVIENSAIPYIETEAARILAALGGSTASCTVELRTQAALKSGDGLRDTLDIVIIDENGAEGAYETFSEGEKTRLNLALSIALAQMLAQGRGAASDVLVIDEPEYLDTDGTAALVELLRTLEQRFSRIYLISHVPALRDSFDDVLTVVKTDGRSRVEQGAVLEAVPA